VLLVYSARGAAWIVEAALARRWMPPLAGLAGAVLVLAGSRSSPVREEAAGANGTCWLAVAEGRAGRHDEAIRLFEEAIALGARPPGAHRGPGGRAHRVAGSA